MVSNGTRAPARRLRSSIQRWSPQPIAAMIGSTAMSAMKGEMSVKSAIRKIKQAARTAKSPWARLMIRITPNMNDRPQASRA